VGIAGHPRGDRACCAEFSEATALRWQRESSETREQRRAAGRPQDRGGRSARGRRARDGEIYNLTNGDVICWRELFRAVAAWLEVPLDESPGPARLAETMPAQAGLWRHIAEREGLHIADLDELGGLSWQYADVLWANPRPTQRPGLVSTIKAREHGFVDCLDSEDNVIGLLERMRDEGRNPADNARRAALGGSR